MEGKDKKNNNNPNTPEQEWSLPHESILLFTTIFYLGTLIIFFLMSIIYGTGCPSANAAGVTVKYGNTPYKFTIFHCYSPHKWLNPGIESSGAVTSDPSDIFLGLFVFPPGLSMIYGIVYTFVVGFFYLVGLLASWRANPSMLRWFANWNWKVVAFNFFAVLFNLLSWFWLQIRAGQNDYAANSTYLCSTFATWNWNLCGYISAELVFAILFFIFGLIAHFQVKNLLLAAPKKEREETRLI